ncbi:MAG TPA: hypothetical protein VE439_09085 [Anaerolineae bacterium]|nr:hypothetical protein [Anaerolineae bacterium]
MGDKFFDDQAKGTPSKSKTPNKSGKAAKKSPASKASKPGVKAAAKAPAKAKSSEGLNTPQQVDVIWTVALVVVAFVIGFFARGIIMPATTNSTSDISTLAPGTSGNVSNNSAPALSQEELQNGQLPEGHPGIGGETTQSSDTTVAPPSGSEMGHGKSDVPASGPLQEGGQSVGVEGTGTGTGK